MQASIIIICKDEIEGLRKTLESVRALTDEVMIYDVSQHDDLKKISHEFNATVYQGDWRGYGHVRYDAVKLAKNDWILLLHAGEMLDKRMRRSFVDIAMSETMVAYRMRFKNYLGNKWMRFGNERGQALLGELDTFLTSLSMKEAGSAGKKYGVGIYFFEDQAKEIGTEGRETQKKVEDRSENSSAVQEIDVVAAVNRKQ